MICVLLMQGIGFYMVFVYAASYLTERMHLTTARALDINTLALLVQPSGSFDSAGGKEGLGGRIGCVVARRIRSWNRRLPCPYWPPTR
jgi:hypothetical protein